LLRYIADIILTPFNMQLRSRILADVEVGDPDPGVPGPSPLVTEGSGEPVPDPGPILSLISEVAGAGTSHLGTARLMRLLR